MSKLASAVSKNSTTVIHHMIEFSLFGGIVTAMAAGVIRLQ
jgi:hypothetical protein